MPLHLLDEKLRSASILCQFAAVVDRLDRQIFKSLKDKTRLPQQDLQSDEPPFLILILKM
jgi:hypothetical protein